MRPSTLFFSLSSLLLISLGGAAPVSAQGPLLHIESVPDEREPASRYGGAPDDSESDLSIMERDRRRLRERYETEDCAKCRMSLAELNEANEANGGESEMGGGANIGMWLGSVDLSGWEALGWGGEVGAIQASQVAPFGTHLLGGLRLGGRLEHEGFIRAPEYQLTILGGELNGPWTATGVGALETRALQATSVGFSVAIGAQLPLGPFRLYGLLRLGLRLGIIDVALRDATLGTLGTETLFSGAIQAGGEVGVEWLVDEEVGFQLSATVDPASGAYGGTFSILIAGED